MTMKKSFFKKKFLKAVILVGLTFNVVNLNAFSVRSIIDGPKNAFLGFVEGVKEIPFEIAFPTIAYSAMILAIVAFIAKIEYEKNKEEKLCSKKIMETCVLCEKLNEECKCDLFEKLNFAFCRYGLHETVRYCNGWYQGRDSDWLEKRIKSVILKINDVNMKFFTENNSLSILQIACLYGHEPIVKWLVEDMFIDINFLDNNGFSASQMLRFTASSYRKMGIVVGETLDSSNGIFKGNVDGLLLYKKEELQIKLLDSVESLKNIITRYKEDENKSIVCSEIKSKLKEITSGIKSKETPGFAKQLVMFDLISIHENFPKFISFSDIKSLYKYISFNYTFLNDERFAKAVKFAKNKEIKDIYERSVDQAREVYKEENKGLKCNNCKDFFEDSVNITYFYKTVQYGTIYC